MSSISVVIGIILIYTPTVLPPALAVRSLDVVYADGSWALRGVDVDVPSGSCLGVVGESGCGKSTLARALLGLLPSGTEVRGSARVAGVELVGRSERELRRVRGRLVGLVGQDPYGSCNPLLRVGRNVAEAWSALRRRPRRDHVVERLAALGIDDASIAATRHPHQWSGGMLQRASIVAATAHRPALLVADEPTSALDAHLADRVVTALIDAATTTVLVSHDLRLIGRHADHVAVLYGGRLVEHGPAADVVDRPGHPYTRALLAAIPQPGARRGDLPVPIPGRPPSLHDRDPGCPFAPRCAHTVDRCRNVTPPARPTPVHRFVACHLAEAAA